MSIEEGQTLAANNNLIYLEASAKTGVSIDEAYTLAAQKILEKVDKKLIDVLNDKYGVKVGLQNSGSSFPVEISSKAGCCKQ